MAESNGNGNGSSRGPDWRWVVGVCGVLSAWFAITLYNNLTNSIIDLDDKLQREMRLADDTIKEAASGVFSQLESGRLSNHDEIMRLRDRVEELQKEVARLQTITSSPAP